MELTVPLLKSKRLLSPGIARVVGLEVGTTADGRPVGTTVGVDDGTAVGGAVGGIDGSTLGAREGVFVIGCIVGEGVFVGDAVGEI